jgi:hypothetical protein
MSVSEEDTYGSAPQPDVFKVAVDYLAAAFVEISADVSSCFKSIY